MFLSKIIKSIEMKLHIIVFLLFFGLLNLNAQNDKIKKEIITAIEFYETGYEKVHTVKPYKKNKDFNAERITISQINYIVNIKDTLELKKDSSHSLVYFVKNGNYKFYISNNLRKLKDYRYGRVSNYSEKSTITKLYNNYLNFAKENDLFDNSLEYCYLYHNRLVFNTMKLILYNKNKNKYIGNNLVIYDSLKNAIKCYFDDNNDFEKYLKTNTEKGIVTNENDKQKKLEKKQITTEN
jgi:hypothetical protein